MVLQKRLEYGFNGHQMPTRLRASRSARGICFPKRQDENNPMTAFDLLVTVAEKLLHEKDAYQIHSNPSAGRDATKIENDATKTKKDEEKLLKLESCKKENCDEDAFVFNDKLQRYTTNGTQKHCFHPCDDVSHKLAHGITKADRYEKINIFKESVNKNKSDFRDFLGIKHTGSCAKGGCAGFSESRKGKVKEERRRKLQAEDQRIDSVISGGTFPNICCSSDPVKFNTKPLALGSSNSSVKLPLGGGHIPRRWSFPRCRGDIKLMSRVDDKDSFRCTSPSTTTMKTLRSPHIGNQGIRKLASKYWKVAPTVFKNRNMSSFDMNLSPDFSRKRQCFTRRRTQSGSTFKRRKVLGLCSMSTSHMAKHREGVSKYLLKDKNGEATDSVETMHGASGISSSPEAQKSFFKPVDSHVRLHIKSFKVPELFVEIPQTATVGSLKRMVLEAVSTILGARPRVGVLHQGEKVRDDNKTLLQTGISHEDELDTLGFTLESNLANSPQACAEAPQLRPHCEATQLLNRNLMAPSLNQVESDESLVLPPTNFGNCIESDHYSVSSPDISLDKTSPNSRDLVAISPLSMEPLALVPLHHKSRRSEYLQRRIRRPFCVSEVEALVEAVEKQGTGRWCDVKLCAFENVRHRTYVDLKDKWKTLVHTARILPQQRRGEPVPQVLLDRVLAAHAYWSQHHSNKE